MMALYDDFPWTIEEGQECVKRQIMKPSPCMEHIRKGRMCPDCPTGMKELIGWGPEEEE